MSDDLFCLGIGQRYHVVSNRQPRTLSVLDTVIEMYVSWLKEKLGVEETMAVQTV